MLNKGFLTLLFIGSLTAGALAQIDCDFSYTTPTGCGGFVVSFCDLSTSSAGDIVAWNWNMEVSTFSVECPSTVFSQPGIYTVCLTVTDSQGNTCTTCKDDLIQVFELPVPDFDGVPTSGCTPLDVTFYDQSTSADGNITQWLWGLGGSCGTIQGNGSTPAAVCTYNIPGAYNISLTITDDNGCINTINKVGYVNVSPSPIIEVSAADTFDCTGPFSVSFNNNSNLTNTNYLWDFGNGQTFEGAYPPAILYSGAGSYTVTVVATDTISTCSDTLVLDNYVNIGYPADFSFTPEEGCEDLFVQFTDESVFVADNVEWDFGDGGTSTAPNPSYVYTQPGCYTVQLTRYVNGCTSVVYSDNCINVGTEPDVSYTNTSAVACELPHPVNFIGISSVATSWHWDFGDGFTSDQQNPTHSYTGFGNFPVTLTVTNATGCTKDTVITTVEITELQGMLVDDFFDGCIPMDVTLSENSISATDIVGWSWEVTNGTAVYTSTDANPTFAIADTGEYDIVLIVTNTLGCVDTATFQNVIEAGDYPDVNFVADPVESCVASPIQFTDLTPGDVDEWYWDFGDGGFSVEQNPEYVYSDTGFYDVSLIVDHNGCISTLTFDDYIHVMAPVAGFNVVNFCEEPLNWLFVNTSIGADSVFWDFGVLTSTSDTTSVTNPEFEFPGPGTYNVVQWVYNSTTTCWHTQAQEIQVTNPQAAFSVDPLEGCNPLSVNTTDQSIDAIQWLWTSVNGTVSDATAQNTTITYNLAGEMTDDIILVVTDVNSCQDTFTFNQSIYVNEVTADFTSDVASGCAPLTVTFDDLSVNDYFAEVVAWNWDFGPGLGMSTQENPTFTFQNPGLYTVILTVTDSWGCTNTITMSDYIDVTLPAASFLVDTLSCTENVLDFQSTSAGWQLDYFWDFGDGSTSTEPNPGYAYTEEGTYTACLTIADGYDCSSEYCVDIVVADPLANFTLDSTFASCPPLPVNFTNLSLNASGFLWDFGDGNAPSDFIDPTYVYTIPGTYDVTLIAISTEDCQDTLVFTDLIVLDGPEGEYTISEDSTCVPAEITFVANSVDYYTYIWDFGTGVIDSSGMPLIYDSVTYYYDQIGTYVPTLSLLNNTGCFRTLPVVSPVYIAGLSAEFEASQTIVCGDDPVGISFEPVFLATDSIIAVEWYFENGNPAISTDLEPIITYNNSTPGYHDVQLITHTPFCSDTLLKEDLIKVGAVPVAGFTMNTNEGCDPLDIFFFDNSTVEDGYIAAWNWDFGDGTTSNATNPSHVFGPGADISINLEVTSDVGCTDNYFDNIVVYPLAEIDAGADVEVCIGEPTQLQGTIVGDTTGVGYEWTPTTGLSCVNCLDPWVVNPLDTITYTLVVTSAEGCTSASDLTVLVRPYEAPDLVLSPDTTICINTLTQLTVDVTNNVVIDSYQWDTDTPGLSCYDNCFNPVAFPEESSTYVVTVTTDHGCVTVDSVAVGVEDQSQPFAGDDKIICRGDSIQLDASFGQNPYWIVNTELSCAYCPDPIAFPDSTKAYIVQVVTPLGCEIIDTIVVHTMEQDEIGAGDDQVVCLGESTQLQGFGPGDISWSPATTLDNPQLLDPEAQPYVTTTYVMTAVNGDCTFSDTMLVEVVEKTALEGQDEVICEGEEIALTIDGVADVYSWEPTGAVSDPTLANPLTSPSQSTEYEVIGTLGICESDTTNVFVDVIPAPRFQLDEIRYYLPGQTITLTVNLLEDGNFSFLWTPATGLSCTHCESPTIEPQTNGVYTLTVTDEDTGCSFNRSVSLQELTACSPDLVGVPNVFSPNDDGFNDELRMIVSPTVSDVRVFSIFDRWGSTVFSTNNRYQGWDGLLKGQEAQIGVYVYMVQFICPLDGRLVTKKGDVTLMR